VEVPLTLYTAIEKRLAGMKHEKLLSDAQNISFRYRNQSGKGERLLTSDSEALAYSVARMPATFGAVYSALEQSLAHFDCSPKSLLDAGAGTGAASWAADAILKLDSVVCLEREEAMRIAGMEIMKEGSEALQGTKWLHRDLASEKITEQADLVIASYVLNEMAEEGRIRTAKKLWNAAKMMLLIVEPGTPAGFSNILRIRDVLLKDGAYIAAPCSHEAECFMSEYDWCHFSCRISRTRLHRQLKGGEAPFEDEKYTYMAFTREKCHVSGAARVLRHPQVRSGHVMLDVCTAEGIKNITLSKKDGEKYKQARKAKAGDEIRID